MGQSYEKLFFTLYDFLILNFKSLRNLYLTLMHNHLPIHFTFIFCFLYKVLTRIKIMEYPLE